MRNHRRSCWRARLSVSASHLVDVSLTLAAIIVAGTLIGGVLYLAFLDVSLRNPPVTITAP